MLSNEAKEAAKRFKMLCEYTFNITEDDGEEDASAINEPQNLEPQEGEGSQMNDTNQANIEQDDVNNGEMGEDVGNVESMDNVQMGDEEQGAAGFNPSVNNGDDFSDGSQFNDETMQPDDEVIDVDELTKSQEDTEDKVDDIHVSMEKGFDKLIGIVNKLDKMIDNNNSNMEQIRKEIEKRNPTPIEKLNMRAANDSYPFNVSPSDYWREKEMNSNYRIGGENEPDAKQYTITQGDIDSVTDFQRISKELDDTQFNQNLMNIFGLR